MEVPKSSKQYMFPTALTIASVLVLVSQQQVAVDAARPLQGDSHRLYRPTAAASQAVNPFLFRQSLPRGKAARSTSSSCTFVPTPGKRRCTTELHAAAPLMAAAFKFGAANDTARNPFLFRQSLPRGKAARSTSSSCTFVPTPGKRRCTTELHAAAPLMAAAFKFGAANDNARNPFLFRQSLPRGKAARSRSSSCTFVPTPGKSRCTTELHAAAPLMAAAFKFGAADDTARNPVGNFS